MAHLSESDRAHIEALRQGGVLETIEPAQLPDHSRGVIVVACADGDQMEDLWTYHATLCQTHGSHARIHTLALNGGALQLAASSPLNKINGEDRVLLEHIRVGAELKKIETVILYAHAPCGAAAIASLDIRGVIQHLLDAEERVKQELPHLKITAFLHVDRGHDHHEGVTGHAKKRTYRVSSRKGRVATRSTSSAA